MQHMSASPVSPHICIRISKCKLSIELKWHIIKWKLWNLHSACANLLPLSEARVSWIWMYHSFKYIYIRVAQRFVHPCENDVTLPTETPHWSEYTLKISSFWAEDTQSSSIYQGTKYKDFFIKICLHSHGATKRQHSCCCHQCHKQWIIFPV